MPTRSFGFKLLPKRRAMRRSCPKRDQLKMRVALPKRKRAGRSVS